MVFEYIRRLIRNPDEVDIRIVNSHGEADPEERSLETWDLFPEELFGVDQTSTKFDLQRVIDEITILPEKQSQEYERAIFSPDEFLRLYTTMAEQNQDAAQLFFTNVRKNATRMIRHNDGPNATLSFTTQDKVEQGGVDKYERPSSDDKALESTFCDPPTWGIALYVDVKTS